jgi:hypothetical protein
MSGAPVAQTRMAHLLGPLEKQTNSRLAVVVTGGSRAARSTRQRARLESTVGFLGRTRAGPVLLGKPSTRGSTWASRQRGRLESTVGFLGRTRAGPVLLGKPSTRGTWWPRGPVVGIRGRLESTVGFLGRTRAGPVLLGKPSTRGSTWASCAGTGRSTWGSGRRPPPAAGSSVWNNSNSS